MLFLMQPPILPVLCYKSVTMCQTDSNKVSNSKLKPELCDCVKTEITEYTALSQQRDTIFGTPHTETKNGENCLAHPVQKLWHKQRRS